MEGWKLSVAPCQDTGGEVVRPGTGPPERQQRKRGGDIYVLRVWKTHVAILGDISVDRV